MVDDLRNRRLDSREKENMTGRHEEMKTVWS